MEARDPIDRWSLAIFSARETPQQLLHAVRAAAAAKRGGAEMTVDIVVNGTPALASDLGALLAERHDWDDAVVRLWSVPQADKAHAWNTYLHAIAPQGRLAFFMDGYVIVEPGAFVKMAAALRNRPDALAATCLPSTGPSARAQRQRLLAEGGLHGNLYALTAATCHRLRVSGVRLPYGIYRNDSALGAALAFDLEPARNRWKAERIVAVPEARYEVHAARVWPPSALRVVLRRRLRQAQGALETRALKAHLAGARRSPVEWPASVDTLVQRWAEEHRADARRLLVTAPLASLALHHMRKRPPRTAAPGAPQLIGRYGRLNERARRAVSVSPA